MEGPDWLRFRLYPLDFDTWRYIETQLAEGKTDLSGIDPDPVLITDFYAYNAQSRELRFQKAYAHPIPMGMHWVGDLALEAEVNVVSESGQLLLDLVEAGRHYTCSIDVATGVATLSIDDGKISFHGDVKHPTAKTRVQGQGSYDIRYANVDDQLSLWVNNQVVQFDCETTYESEDDPQPATSEEDPGDLAPVGIGADGVELEVDRLRVLRDIYYIATKTSVGSTTDYHFDSPELIVSELSDPSAWNRRKNLFSRRNEVIFKLEEDQFFPLGDNSPYSRDGRLWGDEHYVERDLLIGKAIVIYWPHAWRIPIPFTGTTIPLIPNVQRMGLIH
jgi:signal peptidase I